MLPLWALQTLALRQVSSCITVHALCRSMILACLSFGPAPTITRALLLRTLAIFCLAGSVGWYLTFRAHGSLFACLIGQPAVAVICARDAHFSTMIEACRACCSTTTFALAYIGNALACCIFVLAIFAVCAFLITVVGTGRAFGSGLTCVACALFQGALARRSVCTGAVFSVVPLPAHGKWLACFGSGFEIVTCIASGAVRTTM